MGNTIKPHIEHAEKTGTCNLSRSNLGEFPVALLKLRGNLRNLDLSENKLVMVPPSLGDFSSLKNLHLSTNRLVYLPEEIGNLKKLETLRLNNNRLTKLPSSMSKLANLKDFSAANNQIDVFPVQLGGLKNLDSLDLSKNKQKAVPAGVKDIHAIEINLNQNQIQSLSDAIADCPRLKVLRLEENCLPLEGIPSKIFTKSQIALLSLEGNLFEMKKIQELPGYDDYMERYTATKKKII